MHRSMQPSCYTEKLEKACSTRRTYDIIRRFGTGLEQQAPLFATDEASKQCSVANIRHDLCGKSLH